MSNTNTIHRQANEAAQTILRLFPGPIDLGVILGSGLGDLVNRVQDPIVIPYSELPHLPSTTVAGHTGRLVIGKFGRQSVAIFQGRYHTYEGHDLTTVTLPVRILQCLKAPRLILTAATGGIRDDLEPGSIVCISDHINLLGENPLRGTNDDRFGPRFPDMTEVYSPYLRKLATQEAARLHIQVTTGIYACMPGPSYETPAEVRMLKIVGADLVGMSTVPEAIVARQGGIEVLGLAVVTNKAAGISPSLLSHSEVLETSHAAGGQLADLLEAVLHRISRDVDLPLQ